MAKYCSELKILKAIGTDCEKALIYACVTVFSDALHLLYDLHMKDNIDSKMRECKLDPSLIIGIRQKILNGVILKAAFAPIPLTLV